MAGYKPRHQDEDERLRRAMAKTIRSRVRLHFSLIADAYCNYLVAEVLERQAVAAAEGRAFTFSIDDLPALPVPTELP